MGLSPTKKSVAFSPVSLMKDTAFLSTFYQKKQTEEALLYTEYQASYTILTSHYFNGKEKDYESGFHYYGARYYWSEVLTSWLSVDPMADKYPNISPYAYCAWNPVKLVDPDGRFVDDPPTSLRYIIRKGDSFWSLENEWNLPHGTLHGINPSVNPNKIQINQEINAARNEGNYIVVGNTVHVPESREAEMPNEEGHFGMMHLVPSDGFLGVRMAFDALLPSMGSFLSSNSVRPSRGMSNIDKIVERACNGRGSFGVGRGTYAEAMEAGKKWVGKGYSISSRDKNILISKDRKRQFRAPSYKPRLGIYQANFESRESSKGIFTNNGHMDIID